MSDIERTVHDVWEKEGQTLLEIIATYAHEDPVEGDRIPDPEGAAREVIRRFLWRLSSDGYELSEWRSAENIKTLRYYMKSHVKHSGLYQQVREEIWRTHGEKLQQLVKAECRGRAGSRVNAKIEADIVADEVISKFLSKRIASGHTADEKKGAMEGWQNHTAMLFSLAYGSKSLTKDRIGFWSRQQRDAAKESSVDVLDKSDDAEFGSAVLGELSSLILHAIGKCSPENEELFLRLLRGDSPEDVAFSLGITKDAAEDRFDEIMVYIWKHMTPATLRNLLHEERE